MFEIIPDGIDIGRNKKIDDQTNKYPAHGNIPYPLIELMEMSSSNLLSGRQGILKGQEDKWIPVEQLQQMHTATPALQNNKSRKQSTTL